MELEKSEVETMLYKVRTSVYLLYIFNDKEKRVPKSKVNTLYYKVKRFEQPGK